MAKKKVTQRLLSPSRVDPTKTGMMRLKFAARIKAKFKRLKGLILKFVGKDNAFGLVTNVSFKFGTSPAKIAAFRAWLRNELYADIIGESDKQLWERYIRDGYAKGAGRAFDDVRKPYAKGYAKDRSTHDFYRGTKTEFLKSSFGQKVPEERLEVLVSRTFDELENVTSDMATRLTRALADGLVEGMSPDELADLLVEQVGIGETRALVIARTELIRAHAEGQLDALEKLGVEEVGVAVEWSTTGDEKVCPKCRPLEGIVLRIKEARNLLPRHPNCRCAWMPANVNELDLQKSSKPEIDEALEESGLDPREVGISSDRPKSILNQERRPVRQLTANQFENWIVAARFGLTYNAEDNGPNCGTGAGGFQPGNDCAKGSGGGGGGIFGKIKRALGLGPKEESRPAIGVNRHIVTIGGKQHYVKDKKSEELFQSEKLGAQLGKEVGLTVAQVTEHNGRVASEYFGGRQEGTFDLRGLYGTDPAALIRSVPREDVEKHALFDFILGNNDSNEGNTLVTKDRRLIGIDKEAGLRVGPERKDNPTAWRAPPHLHHLTDSGMLADFRFSPNQVAHMREKGNHVARRLDEMGEKVRADDVRKRLTIMDRWIHADRLTVGNLELEAEMGGR